MKNKNTHLYISVILTILGFVITFFFKDYITFSNNIFIPILLIVIALFNGYPIYKRAFNGVRYKVIGIDLLVSIASIGALFIEEYWEAIAVTFLFILGAYLESRTINKTRESISKLIDLTPLEARRFNNEKEEMVLAKDIIVNDYILVKTGEKVAVDGVINKGNGYLDESLLTGESVPVFKEEDSHVYSGTILNTGYIVVKTDKVGKDTTFAKIINMVEESQDGKAKSQAFIEVFAKYYTPLIFILAIISYFISRFVFNYDNGDALRLGLTLLVVSCPGALVIATPISIVAGIGNGAKKGLLFKGGNTLESLSNTKVIAFDKTGTLTEGKLEVNTIYSENYNDKEVLKLAALGELYSEHPIGLAIINKAKELNIDLSDDTELVEVVVGKGLVFSHNKKKYYLGNLALYEKYEMSKTYLDNHKKQESLGRTTIILGTKDEVIGLISLSDTIRSDAKEMIKNLRSKGYNKLVMLTGDNELVAKNISNSLGIDEYYGSLLPEDKLSKIKELKAKYGHVTMIGDGVNDAPALAESDIGIAIGALGKDIAMETADVILMSGQMSKLNSAMKLSKKVRYNILQNVMFAVLVTIILLLGVLTSYVNMSFGMLIHELSVILVIFNAMRLLYIKE